MVPTKGDGKVIRTRVLPAPWPWPGESVTFDRFAAEFGFEARIPSVGELGGLDVVRRAVSHLSECN
jgi:hypothetical protein